MTRLLVRRRAGRGPQVLVRGRPIEVDLALTQQGVRSLAAQRSVHATGARDNRNLYLVRAPDWATMSVGRERR